MNMTPEHWSALSALLDEALEVPVSERSSWLESLQGKPDALKKELRELLSHSSSIETSDFLNTLPKFDAGASVLTPSMAAGTRIGVYVIEEEIGRGGMGIVWRAHRADGAVKRTVALKCPRTDAHGSELMKRFLLERDILAELEHPNIARLYDAGIAEGGQPYIALEYVEGLPLKDYSDRHRLSIEQRLALMHQVLSAVQYAHTHLVIHRDLKPSNILVTTDGHVRLLDFGVAKLLPAHSASEAVLTQLGERALTPDYAAPEHVTGGVVTTATDVYSLGVVLYELLTSQRPYRLQRGSVGEIEEAIVVADPIRPDRVSITAAEAECRSTSIPKLRRILAGDLGTILLKALKKNPAERYPTVEAFANDLRRYQRHEPVLAQADSYAYRVRKFVTRNKLSVTVAGIAFLAILIGAISFAVEARVATAQRDRALALASRNDAVSQFLSDVVTEAAQSGQPMNVGDLLARSETIVNQEYRAHPAHRAAVFDMLANYYFTAGDPGKALSLLDAALIAATGTKDNSLQDRLHCDHGIVAARLGSLAAGAQEIDAVLSKSDVESPQIALCLTFKGYIAQENNDGTAALDYATRALALVRSQPEHLPITEAASLDSVAWASHLAGKNLDADRYYGEAVAAYEVAGRGAGVELQLVRSNWAAMSLAAGDPRSTLQQIDAVLKTSHELNPLSQAPYYLLANRASALEHLGRYQDAKGGYEACVIAAEQAHDVSTVLACNLGLAALFRIGGQVSLAEDAYTHAASIADSVNLPTGTSVTRRWIERGWLDLEEHQYANAGEHLTKAIGEQKTGPFVAEAVMARAAGLLMQQNREGARLDAERALAIAQALRGDKPYSYQVGEASLVLGRVLSAQGDRNGARNAFRAAVDHLSHTVDEQQKSLVAARDWLDKVP